MKNLYILLALFLLGCAHPQKTSPSGSEDKAFERLAEDYLKGYLAWRPQMATGLGLHQYDGKVTDFSQNSLAAELERLKTFDQKLATLNTEQLGTTASHDNRLLRASIQREIFSFEQMRVYSQNPMTYAGVLDVNIYIKRNFAPFEDRARSVISILQQAPKIMSNARANLAEALPRPYVETAIEMASGAADFLGKDLVEALKDLKNEKLRTEFDAANKQAMAELRSYVTYLRDQKLPKANDAYALGRDKYMKLLEYSEMVSMPPEQLLEVGLQELHGKQEVFASAAREIDPSNTAVEVFKAIQKDHPTAENLISDTAKNLDEIRQFVIERKIVTIPSRVKAKVAETPQFMRATSFASMDTPGPFETKATEAYYYVTPVETDWTPKQKEEWLTAFNYYDIDVTSIHEAYPGHYVQFLCLNASPATRLEKIFTGYAFTEGWAHYAEQMMLDEGFGAATSAAPSREEKLRAAKYRLAQTDEALLRICRFCVSIKMHCQGMTVDEATRFFMDNCYYEEKPARQEAIRGTFDPEYLYYTLGKLEILKLREDYRRQEASAFSLEKFHNQFLRHGAPPIRLLREIMLKDPSLWSAVL